MDSLCEKLITLFELHKVRIALHLNNQEISYGNLLNSIIEWKGKMNAIGLQDGMRVCICGKDSLSLISIYMVLWLKHCTIIPIEEELYKSEIGNVIHSSQCHCIITADSVKNLSSDTTIVETKAIDKEWNFILLDREVTTSENKKAMFFYTSGTTGKPKCVMFSHEAIYANSSSLAKAMNLTSQDILYSPMSIILPGVLTTVLLPAFMKGASVVLSNSIMASGIIKNISEKQVTVFYAVPYIFNLLNKSIASDKDKWSSVRLCITSSAYLEKLIFEEFYNKNNVMIHSMYCSSEGGAVTLNMSNEYNMLRDSVGQVLENMEVKIEITEQDAEAENEEGELLIRGENTSLGYLNQEELNKKVFLHGWIRSGDYARVDKNGYIFIVGRISDTINVGGFLVNPLEVENIISKYPNVHDVVVYGQKDVNMGEVITANIVVANKKQELDIDQLIKYCGEKLQNFKIPRKINIVDTLQTSRYGKKVRKYS